MCSCSFNIMGTTFTCMNGDNFTDVWVVNNLYLWCVLFLFATVVAFCFFGGSFTTNLSSIYNNILNVSLVIGVGWLMSAFGQIKQA